MVAKKLNFLHYFLKYVLKKFQTYRAVSCKDCPGNSHAHHLDSHFIIFILFIPNTQK